MQRFLEKRIDDIRTNKERHIVKFEHDDASYFYIPLGQEHDFLSRLLLFQKNNPPRKKEPFGFNFRFLLYYLSDDEEHEEGNGCCWRF